MMENEEKYCKFRIGQIVYHKTLNLWGIITSIELNYKTVPDYDVLYTLHPYKMECVKVFDDKYLLSIDDFLKQVDIIVFDLKNAELMDWLDYE